MEANEEENSSPSQPQLWIQEQDCLKRRLKLFDEFSWKVHSSDIGQDNLTVESRVGVVGHTYLRYVGGVDLSFVKEDSSVACGCIVVIDLETMTVVYEDYNIVHLMLPYVAGFLAFRESPVLLELLNKLAIQNPALYPQVLMVDGNGILHPRGFGLASHLGVLLDIPSIGVAKNLHFVDGLTHDQVRTTMQDSKDSKDELLLIGKSGQIWGAALRSTGDCCKPIFVSIGHRISLETALLIVKTLCKYRIPEPVRQADIRSRRYLQDHYKR